MKPLAIIFDPLHDQQELERDRRPAPVRCEGDSTRGKAHRSIDGAPEEIPPLTAIHPRRLHWARMDDDSDETLEETFPASDAPANTPETGILLDGHAPIDN